MIPTIPESATPDADALSAIQMPGRTYRLDLASKRIVGMVDNLDAVTQAVYKTLYTERYAYLIYDWDYGMELEDYIGQSMDFVIADIGQAITEAIEGDDRVLSVQGFTMKKTGIDVLSVAFTVSSTEGKTRVGLEVAL